MKTILHFPAQPHFFSFGGFDIQMNRIIDYTNRQICNARKANVWSPNEYFDIAHFWGNTIAHSINIRFCKENNKKVIISGLFPYYNGSIIKAKAQIMNYIGRRLGYLRYYEDVDIITVINEDQFITLSNYFKFPSKKIRIVPTILDDYLFEHDASQLKTLNGDSILCVGTICQRKNQINLAKAALELRKTIHFVGRFDDREKHYMNEFIELQRSSNGLINHSSDINIEELVELYKNSSMIACISLVETEPASILEGMFFSKPLLISNQPFGRNRKFNGAVFCDENDIHSIKMGITKALGLEPPVIYNNFDKYENYSQNVLPKYKNIYEELLFNK